jgi:hypothetical protein
MLESLYATIFRPSEVRVSAPAAIAIGLLIALILALNAAGTTNLGAAGIIGFTLLFCFAGVLGWYWLTASVHFLAQLLGGQGSVQGTMKAVAQGLWPLLLTGPAIAAAQWSERLGELFSFGISVGVFVTLVAKVRHTHQLNWLSAILCLAITLTLSFLALSGLILWPLMIILGM